MMQETIPKDKIFQRVDVTKRIRTSWSLVSKPFLEILAQIIDYQMSQFKWRQMLAEQFKIKCPRQTVNLHCLPKILKTHNLLLFNQLRITKESLYRSLKRYQMHTMLKRQQQMLSNMIPQMRDQINPNQIRNRIFQNHLQEKEIDHKLIKKRKNLNKVQLL